jgi:hypothetical protein
MRVMQEELRKKSHNHSRSTPDWVHDFFPVHQASRYWKVLSYIMWKPAIREGKPN